MTGEAISRGQLITIARGDRGYIHSTDMIDAAPVGDDLESFQFRFFSSATAPGRWMPVPDDAFIDGGFAELRIERGDVRENWYFACPDPDSLLEKAADHDFTFEPSGYSLNGHVVSGPLQAGVPLWPQLIEAIRFAGTLVVPDKEWLIGSISGDAACFDPIGQDTQLSIDMRRASYTRVVAPFSTTAGAVGRIVALPKPEEG